MDSPRGQSAGKTASSYTREVSLAGMRNPDAFNEYVKRATGEKFLVTRHAYC
jgi:hypothetical protein